MTSDFRAGDVGFAVFRALQTQHRVRLLALLQRLAHEPDTAAHLLLLDDSVIESAVADYAAALEHELPRPALLQVRRFDLRTGQQVPTSVK